MRSKNLTDGFGRQISYVRLSLTDRCDLRCVYCMDARPRFLPRSALLSPEEIERLVRVLVARGVRKLRLTGGEPLVRREFIEIAERISQYDLDILTLTTNGTLLPLYAKRLYDLGVRSVNISLDSLRADVFRRITRGGDLAKTLRGIEAARQAGLRVKLNLVALAAINQTEIPHMIAWAHQQDMTLRLIETMPMSDTGFDLTQHYLPLSRVRAELEKKWHLTPDNSHQRYNGPAYYVRIAETGGRLGFITPMTHNFCASCNRIRIAANGRLYACLGHADYIDLSAALKSDNDDMLNAMIDEALSRKAPQHHFFISRDDISGSPKRAMAMTGG